MDLIWTDELWNVLHILAPLLSRSDYIVFYEWMNQLAQDRLIRKWLQDHPVEDKMDLVSWVIHFRKMVQPKWKPNYIPIFYTKERMNKDVWGPYLWKWLHELSYQSSLLTQMSLTYIVTLLPCPVCKKHALLYIKKHPFVDDMVVWTIAFHNDVSARLNKEYGTKKKIYTRDEAYQLYH